MPTLEKVFDFKLSATFNKKNNLKVSFIVITSAIILLANFVVNL